MNTPQWYNIWKSKRQNNQWAKQTVKQLKRVKTKRLACMADQAHQQFFKQHDCLDCANCCSSLPVLLTQKDSQRLAKTLQLKTAEFETLYTTQDEDGDTVLKESPCPFLLQNKHCSIYENRPLACRDFPHTQGFDIVDTLGYQVQNTKHCPASYYILQDLGKQEL